MNNISCSFERTSSKEKCFPSEEPNGICGTSIIYGAFHGQILAHHLTTATCPIHSPINWSFRSTLIRGSKISKRDENKKNSSSIVTTSFSFSSLFKSSIHYQRFTTKTSHYYTMKLYSIFVYIKIIFVNVYLQAI